MQADPTDCLWESLEQAESPMSTDQIARAPSYLHGEDESVQSLAFWRREHAVVKGDEGNWTRSATQCRPRMV